MPLADLTGYGYGDDNGLTPPADAPLPNPPPPANPAAIPASFQPPAASVQPPAGLASVAGQPAPRGVSYQAGESGQPNVPPVTPQYSVDPADIWRRTEQGGGARPAGFTPTTRGTTLTGKAPSKEFEQAVADKLQADQDQIAAQNRYDVALGGAQSEAQKRLALIDEINSRNQAQRAAATQAKLAVDRDHIQNLMQQAAKPQQSASEEYWGSKSTFGKIMTGLSMALRGFVFSGYGRGGDPMEWLNQQIGQVVQDQQNRAARNREAVGNAQTLYGMNKEALGDDERSALATELALRTQVGAQLDRRIAEATADPAAQLRGANFKKAIADANEATLGQYWEKTADQHTTKQEEAYHAAQNGPDFVAHVKRAVEAKKGVNELFNENDTQNQQLDLQKKQADLIKTLVETGKTKAEAEKIVREATGGTGLGQEKVTSTAWDPTRFFQGTEAHGAVIDQDAYNAHLEAALSKTMSPRLVRDAYEKLKINPGDEPSTIASKQAAAARLQGASSSIPGVTPGVAPGAAPPAPAANSGKEPEDDESD